MKSAQMADSPIDLARARVLVSNDDGIEAPGLKLLERLVRTFAADVWVVAPEHEQSAAGHSLTIRRPLRIRKLSPRRFAVDGTPTDSVLLAIQRVMGETPPDLVISGINRGGNLGEDVTYSGTVAAAMEATLMGIPAIALSQVADDQLRTRWSPAKRWASNVIQQVVNVGWPRNVLINVNFPDVPAAAVTGIQVCRQGRRKIGSDLAERLDPRGRTYFWIGPQRVEDRYIRGTDLEAVERGAIAVTPLSLDLTHRPTLAAMKKALN